MNNETKNETFAEAANEKKTHESLFDGEVFNDESSYDSDKLLCGISTPMEFSYYKREGSIKKGAHICISELKMTEIRNELESLFGKLSCHNSVNDFDLSADALVYETIDYAKGEMTKGDVLAQDDEIIKDFKPLEQPVPEKKIPSDLLVSSVVTEDEIKKRCFFDKMLKVPKGKVYPVLAFEWKEQRIDFFGVYKLYPIESCMQQRVVMKYTSDTFTIN